MRYLSLCFGGVLELTEEEFKAQYGSQSGRIGSASAASNAGLPLELWGEIKIHSFSSISCHGLAFFFFLT